jgi:hypothetical protein
MLDHEAALANLPQRHTRRHAADRRHLALGSVPPPTRQRDQPCRIDRAAHRRTAAIDLEVQMRTRREAGRALQPDHRPRRHLIAVADQHRLQVGVGTQRSPTWTWTLLPKPPP